MKRLLFLTGRPGIGKTSVLLRAAEELKRKGYRVGGMISREIREKGIRIGFEIIDFHSGKKGWLAHVNQPTGPKLGKYRVNMELLNLLGAGSIQDAVQNAQIIIIDEIGPMELFSKAFKDSVNEAIKSGKLLLGTIHFRAYDPLINLIKSRDDAEVIEVTYENRVSLHKTLIEKSIKALKSIDSWKHKM